MKLFEKFSSWWKPEKSKEDSPRAKTTISYGDKSELLGNNIIAEVSSTKDTIRNKLQGVFSVAGILDVFSSKDPEIVQPSNDNSTNGKITTLNSNVKSRVGNQIKLKPKPKPKGTLVERLAKLEEPTDKQARSAGIL